MPITSEVIDPEKVLVMNPYLSDPLVLDDVCSFELEFHLEYQDSAGVWQVQDYPEAQPFFYFRSSGCLDTVQGETDVNGFSCSFY